MSFDVPATAYDAYMGRFSEPLADQFVALLQPAEGQRALDVGCGPGALTARLAEVLGEESVAAVDPSAPFVAAAQARLPLADIRPAAAERLPFADNEFDRVAAQLVVHFMTDAGAGVAEMARVARPGALVAACVWDHAGGVAPMSVFWRAAAQLDRHARDESKLAGARDGHLVALFTAAGLHDVRQQTLTVRLGFSGFDQWWAPFVLGVGPTGVYFNQLDEAHRERLRLACAEILPSGPFEMAVSAWAAVGLA